MWFLFLCVPILFVICIWGFFDRARYKTYRKAQVIVSNYLRITGEPTNKITLDQEIMDLLNSDKEDLGLNLETGEWVYCDVTGSCRLWCFLWSHRLILSSNWAYGITSNPFRHSAIKMEYDKIEYEPTENKNDVAFKIKEKGSNRFKRPKYIFEIKISYENYEKIKNAKKQLDEPPNQEYRPRGCD